MLCEDPDMTIEALELREKCSDGRNCTSDCPFNIGKPCPAAEGCPGWEDKMSKYDVIPQDVKEYYEKKIQESGIRMVPGHYPVLMTKEAVDKFIEMSKSLSDYFVNEND